MPLLAQESHAAEVETQNVQVDGYRGIWYSNEKSGDEFVYKYSGGLGTYCAKHRPFAIYAPAAHKTFFCYGGATQENHRQLVHMVSYFDHATGLVPRPTLLLDKQTDDAHDNPVISLDQRGHVWVFSTSHGRERPSFVHRSSKPYCVDEFVRVNATYELDGQAVPLSNFSYLQVWPREQAGFTAFFTRYSDPAKRTLLFMKSANGQAWSHWQRLAAIEEGHYQVSTSHRDHHGTAFNYHPTGKGLNYRTNLYYAETRDGGRTWQNVAGEPLSLPLTDVRNAALVRDFEAEGSNVYMKDIQFDEEGNPVILIIASGGYEPGPINGPRVWSLAHWTNGQWKFSTITQSDNNYDMGSLYVEQGQWRLIAPTEIGPQAYNPGGEVCLWTSRDRGATWQRSRQLTSHSPLNHGYVRRPVQAHRDFYALWADGHGRRPSESRLYFCNQQGDVFQLPAKMDGQFARPQKLPATPE
jgi:hypothetical protein